ncbi:MAG: glycosyltransferase family 2 protein [Hyphomicrobiaceae bacterium]
MTVSVIICACNRNISLNRAVASVINQTLAPHEIIIVDDGSSPDGALPDHLNMKLIRHGKNCGIAAARNTGIRAASGEYVAFLKAGDTWRPSKLEHQVRLLSNAPPDVCGAFSSFEYHRDTGALRAGIVETPQVDDWLGCFCKGLRSGPGSTLMAKRRVFDDIGYFDEGLEQLEDWDWLLRAAKRFKFQTTARVLSDVVCSASPAPGRHLRALDRIAARHVERMPDARYRRTLEAALAIEAAAAHLHERRLIEAAQKVMASLVAPRVIVGELFRTIRMSRPQGRGHVARSNFDPITSCPPAS